MGRIKSTFIKASGNKIYEKASNEFSLEFNKNKEVVGKYANIPSKKLRNKIVGQICRIAKKASEEDN